MSAGLVQWLDANSFEVDGQRFVIENGSQLERMRSTSDFFVLGKTVEMVERFAERSSHRGDVRRILELGMFQGGSTALQWVVYRPERIVAVDLNPDPVLPLEHFIAARGLEDRIHLHYAVDQTDRDTLEAIRESEFGDEPIDLVIDDASHLYEPTRVSFEVLFPYVREGGMYVIEDWGWAHFPGERWQDEGGYFAGHPALTNLIIEILMLAESRPDIVSEVRVLSSFAEVVRGPAAIESPMTLSDLYLNRGLRYRPLL